MTPEELKEYYRRYYQENKHKWIAANPEKNRKSKQAYKARNKEKITAYNKQWAKNNAGRITAYARAYQLAKARQMPSWLPEDHRKAIETFYENRPEGFHVDHIVPLRGENVSGLHVIWNLQYLPATENVKKSNKF